MTAPVIVFGIGNVARGDDGIGPEVARRLRGLALSEVEVVEVHQLQVEHSLDLAERRAVVFADAAVGFEDPWTLEETEPVGEAVPFSHALAPAALLDAFHHVEGRPPPPAWTFAVRGEEFSLGATLGASALENLDAGWPALRRLIDRLIN